MIQHLKRLRISLSGLTLGLALLFIPTLTYAQGFEFNTKRNKESILFKFVKNLVVVQVMINDVGPFNFILDTGVSTFLITDPKLFHLLDIRNYREVKIAGLGEGNDLSAYVVRSVNVKIGSSVEGNIPAAILKEEKLNLSGFTGLPIHGLLGYEFFSSFIVRFNYASDMLTLYRNETAYIPKKGWRMPITIEERKPYLISEIAIGDTTSFRAKLIIDTGAGHPVSLETNDGKPINVPEKNIEANLGVGLSGPINGYLSRLKSVKLGKFELRSVISAFPNYDDVAAKVSNNRNGNIGNAILKHFDVVFDYHRQRLYLKPSIYFRQPFEHDMSGMQFEAAGDNYEKIFIRSIEPGSAAEEAGLREGDQITSINLKSVKELNLQEIENMFRSGDGRNYLLDIISTTTKKRESVILSLRRRV